MYGDSKAAWGYVPQYLQPMLPTGTNAVKVDGFHLSGNTSTQIAARAAADAEAKKTNPPIKIMVSAGANNMSGNLAGLTTDFGAIADALRGVYSTVLVYFSIPWVRNFDAQADVAAQAITDACSTRVGWCFAGTDERVLLKGSDNGSTNTADGVHPSAAGSAALAASWKAILGY
jgi:lysophospholipase L1-like esterase